MPAKRTTLAGLVAVGFQQISLSNSTAQGLNSTVRNGAHVLDLSVDGENARYRQDGSDPTLTTGVILFKDNTYRWEGLAESDIANLKFIRQTGTCIINVQSYKHHD